MKNISIIQANITISLPRENKGMSIKAFLSMTPCYLFLYVNSMMIFTMQSRSTFLEKSRYILFSHMLYTDSIQLVLSAILYLLAIAGVQMSEITCLILVIASAVFTRISPLNLVLMSLERFVAICFPLRHAEMSTVGRTRLCICAIWLLGTLDSLTMLFVFVIHKSPSSSLKERYCSLAVYGANMHRIEVSFTFFYFVSSSVIITYTYIAIVRAAKSLTDQAKKSTSKSNETVLLHLVQLSLCLTSLFFNFVTKEIRPKLGEAAFLNIQYFLFMIFIICPRCLSPLIYGLRDQAFGSLFKYYFLFGTKAVVKPTSTQ
ncbi:hypothetical protein ACEWY4_010049 [Coilia grayii]|uniref:G-protein coupled receptors family 1 profile domain-containing protein n=1 Tax=Coilia grayii TaxID=363190 RepID=A0ABD1K875_9TELE